MIQRNDDFMPGTVDEQIEQLSHGSGRGQPYEAPNKRLVETLQRIYQPNATVSVEDTHSLERIRQRIADKQQAAFQTLETPEERFELQRYQEEHSFRKNSRKNFPTKQTPLYRGLSVLAAVVVLSLAVGSLVVVLNLAPRSHVASPKTMTTNPTILPTPTLTPASLPPSHSNIQLAYDSKTDTLLLFSRGGDTGSTSETWTWDGKTWTHQHSAISPPPRRDDSSMAYDVATGQILLFGGSNGGPGSAFGDTWTWDGKTWTQQHPVNSPPARTGASMAYDAATQRLVLFGGVSNGPGIDHVTGPPMLNDTWTWNGTNWTHLHPTTFPSARSRSGMAYDAATQRLVLFGGMDNNPDHFMLNDTWTWNGTNWTHLHPATSPAISFSVSGIPMSTYGTSFRMSNDDTTRQILLTFIGEPDTGTKVNQVSWVWNGTTWTQVAIQSMPLDTFVLELFYSSAQHTVLAFSYSVTPNSSKGITNYYYFDKLWKWDGQQWRELLSWGPTILPYEI